MPNSYWSYVLECRVSSLSWRYMYSNAPWGPFRLHQWSSSDVIKPDYSCTHWKNSDHCELLIFQKRWLIALWFIIFRSRHSFIGRWSGHSLWLIWGYATAFILGLSWRYSWNCTLWHCKSRRWLQLAQPLDEQFILVQSVWAAHNWNLASGRTGVCSQNAFLMFWNWSSGTSNTAVGSGAWKGAISEAK